MAYRPYPGGLSQEQPWSGEPDTGPVISSRISSISDFSSPGPYEPETEPAGPGYFSSPYDLPPRDDIPLGREAVDFNHIRVSPTLGDDGYFGSPSSMPLESPRRGPAETYSTVSNLSGYSWMRTDRYESLSPISAKSRSSTGLSRIRSIASNTGRRSSRHQSIPEGDEMDLALIQNVKSFSHGSTVYRVDEERDAREDELRPLGVDISTFTGPESPQDAATVLRYRELEREGQLTGGLGSGLKPEITIRSSDLHAAASPISPLQLTRRLSRRVVGPGRNSTLQDLGQREANKRGKIIEVVVEEWAEEPDPVDISVYAGDDGTPPVEFDPLHNRQPTFKPPAAKIYYPQPNWKPHSMRWPYLATLVVISLVLAAGQEFLYQRSRSLANSDPPSGLFTFTNAEDLSTWDYFSFKYLPTVIAVMYGILWQFTDYEVKRLEPYHRLSKEGGALAAESINIDYITIFNIFRPLQALRYQHYAVALSSMATLMAVSLVPTLQSASIVLQPDRTTRFLNPQSLKLINMHPIWSRVLTGVLGAIAILGLTLLCQLQFRRSGLAGDVKGIAGLAAMATKSHVLMDFKDLDTVPPQDIYNKLKNHRYSLRNSSLTSDEAAPVSREDQEKYDRYRLSANPHPLMMRLIAGVPFVGFMIAFAIFIPLCIFTPADIVLDKAPWLLTALAVAIKIGFQTLEQDVRLMEPFYRLSRRHAPPKVLTLDYTTMAFGYMPIRALLNGDLLIASVGLGSVLAEILTVCATSFAGVSIGVQLKVIDSTESTSETPHSFWVSFSLSIFILAYLIISASSIYKLRRHPFLPRQPSTIASVLAFIHQSKMLYDFVAVPAPGSEAVSQNPRAHESPKNSGPNSRPSSPDSNPDRNTSPRPGITPAIAIHATSTGHDQDLLIKKLTKMGKTYGYGWFTGRDGQKHCGVDQEELIGYYKHRAGDDVRKATDPWLGYWEYRE